MAHYDTVAEDVKADYGRLKTKFITQFSGLESSHFLVQRLHQMRQREGEKLEDYTNRFQELARRAYTEFSAKD